MIKNKYDAICADCGKIILPLEGKSIGKETVDCKECRKPIKGHIFVHVKCPVIVHEIPICEEDIFVEKYFYNENKDSLVEEYE